jgi:hypothetical protein
MAKAAGNNYSLDYRHRARRRLYPLLRSALSRPLSPLLPTFPPRRPGPPFSGRALIGSGTFARGRYAHLHLCALLDLTRAKPMTILESVCTPGL